MSADSDPHRDLRYSTVGATSDLDSGVEVAGYVRNVTDEKNVIGAIDFNNLTAFVNEPRTDGVQVSKCF